MCIRDRIMGYLSNSQADDSAKHQERCKNTAGRTCAIAGGCLLYTSDAADERSSVDLGGRRIIKKKNNKHNSEC